MYITFNVKPKPGESSKSALNLLKIWFVREKRAKKVKTSNRR
jgi:hypothetical protein